MLRKWFSCVRRLAGLFVGRIGDPSYVGRIANPSCGQAPATAGLETCPTDDEVAAQCLAVPAHFAIALGADIAMSTDGGNTYTTLGNVVDVLDSGDADVQDEDVSYLQQPDASMRFAPGLINEGEYKFKIYWNAAKYASARAQIRTSNYFKITWPDKINATNSTELVQGYIKKLGKSLPIKGNMITDIAIKISGQPAFTQAT